MELLMIKEAFTQTQLSNFIILLKHDRRVHVSAIKFNGNSVWD